MNDLQTIIDSMVKLKSTHEGWKFYKSDIVYLCPEISDIDYPETFERQFDGKGMGTYKIAKDNLESIARTMLKYCDENHLTVMHFYFVIEHNFRNVYDNEIYYPSVKFYTQERT